MGSLYRRQAVPPSQSVSCPDALLGSALHASCCASGRNGMSLCAHCPLGLPLGWAPHRVQAPAALVRLLYRLPLQHLRAIRWLLQAPCCLFY